VEVLKVVFRNQDSMGGVEGLGMGVRSRARIESGGRVWSPGVQGSGVGCGTKGVRSFPGGKSFGS
jgi:hypothetical protein